MSGEAKILIGCIVMAIDNAHPVEAGVLQGNGRVYIGPWLPGSGSGKGSFRVKVLLIDDE